MNERAAPAEADARRWACATLGVAEDASPDVVRAAFLKQVGEADFYPSQESVAAWQWLAGTAAADPRAERIVSERMAKDLRASVEQFAEQFFSIEVTERVRQWFDLSGRCQASPALTARLEGLSAGLHIDAQAVLAGASVSNEAGASSGPSARTLAEKTFELFVLRPVDRAERQQELLGAWRIDQKVNAREWQNAARTFKKQFPKIAELDTEFVDTILGKPKPLLRTAAAAAAASPAPTNQGAATTGKWKNWSGSIGGIVVLVCMSVVSRCARDEPRIGNFKSQAQKDYEEQLRKLRQNPTPNLPLWQPQPMPNDEASNALERLRDSLNKPVETLRYRKPDNPSPVESPSPTESPAEQDSVTPSEADARPPPDE